MVVAEGDCAGLSDRIEAARQAARYYKDNNFYATNYIYNINSFKVDGKSPACVWLNL